MHKILGETFFVTGGAGFIGSCMVERLLNEGANVIAYDNLSTGRYEFIKKFEGNKNFRFIKADMLDTEALDSAFKQGKIDTIIHFAANPNIIRGMKETDLDLKQGTVATYNILETARKNDVKRILFSSSSVIYGIPTVVPTTEDYGPLRPISLYGASKLAAEALITAYSHLFDMEYYIYRFANIVGKNSTHGIIYDLIQKLKKDRSMLEVLGDGEQRKSYIDVEDCVNGMLHVYQKSNEKENVYNIAPDDQISVKEIAEMVIARVSEGAKIRYTGTKQGWPGDITNTYVSNEKLKRLGWTYKCDSRQTVSNTIDIILSEDKQM